MLIACRLNCAGENNLFIHAACKVPIVASIFNAHKYNLIGSDCREILHAHEQGFRGETLYLKALTKLRDRIQTLQR